MKHFETFVRFWFNKISNKTTAEGEMMINFNSGDKVVSNLDLLAYSLVEGIVYTICFDSHGSVRLNETGYMVHNTYFRLATDEEINLSTKLLDECYDKIIGNPPKNNRVKKYKQRRHSKQTLYAEYLRISRYYKMSKKELIRTVIG